MEEEGYEQISFDDLGIPYVNAGIIGGECSANRDLKITVSCPGEKAGCPAAVLPDISGDCSG